MSDKSALRREMAARRKMACAEVDPAPAQSRLLAVLHKAEGPISAFWPFRTEIDTRPVLVTLAAQGRDLCLPVTRGAAPLLFRRWRAGDTLVPDTFGVMTPQETAEALVPRTLVVPLLGFDASLNRLGYGGGHYDRTLAALGPDVLAIGFAFEAQRLDQPLPVEPTDVALDCVVTERGVYCPD